MDIQTAAKYASTGYRIRRTSWKPEEWISAKLIRKYVISLTLPDLLADDWVIITEGIVSDFPLTYSD